MTHSAAPLPRIVVAGLSGGSGKTIVSLGLARALSARGLAVRPFKKGPDYIDAKWLALAADGETCNLDPFLTSNDIVRALFADRMRGHDIGLVEGNRGVFDGSDEHGSLSTAALARLVAAPTLLVLDATKMTRTAAALVAGINNFEPDFRLAGVVLNRTAGPRHRSILKASIERYTNVPVLGMLPKLPTNPIPERHMGLMSDQEMHDIDADLDALGVLLAEHVDLDAILAAAHGAPEFGPVGAIPWPEAQALVARPRIGVVRDAALWFYYPENIEALERAGAEVVPVSILDDAPWPELHGLYLGGGFPETHAARLSANWTARDRVRALCASGAPVYAECGGFMYLARALRLDSGSYDMAGVLPLSTHLCERPQGLGYIEAVACRETPFHPAGARLKGHEFHYSSCADVGAAEADFSLELTRGVGMAGNRDGLLRGNTFVAYVHLHALGALHWAPRFVLAAARFAGIV